MSSPNFVKAAILWALALCTPATVAEAQPRDADTIALTVRANQSGPTISRDIFGQFAEHLGSGIYGGLWVGRDSPIANVRGIRTDVVLARRPLRGAHLHCH